MLGGYLFSENFALYNRHPVCIVTKFYNPI